MTILHEAYLFTPKEFATSITLYTEALAQDGQAYYAMRNAAIELYDRSERVRRFAIEYAGWDRDSIMQVAGAADPTNPTDIAFWLVLMLYNHFESKPNKLGLFGNWDHLLELFPALGLSETDCRLLVYGHNFGGFPGKYLPQITRSTSDVRGSDPGYWTEIKPSSTCAEAGWLDSTDVDRLLEQLHSFRGRIVQKDPSPLPSNHKLIEATYDLAMQMLTAASKARFGLCLILSG